MAVKLRSSVSKPTGRDGSLGSRLGWAVVGEERTDVKGSMNTTTWFVSDATSA